jgi:alpha-1,3-glucosyltransferase
LECFLPAPARYPDIYPVTNVLLSFSIFTLAWLVALYKSIEMSVRMVAFGSLGGKKTGAGVAVAAGEKKRV